MRILILGSEGFIGKHCVASFLSNGDEVYGADLFEQPSAPYRYRKISRLSPEIDELLGQDKFDVVINTAGSGNVSYSMTHPLIDFEANALDSIKILDALRKVQPSAKYIHLSSAAVYGNPKQLPVKETDTPAPLSPYGWHKLISEHLCKEYTAIYGLQTAIVRPFSVYGPGLKKQLFWDLYQKIIKANDTIELFGTGNESRDFIFITDMVKAIRCIIENGAMEAEVYNLASGEETSISNVVKIYIDALKLSRSCSFNGQVRHGDPLNWRADISKIRSIGFTPSVSLKNGLNEVAAWINSLEEKR